LTETRLADINHASLERLIDVPGIGPALAKRIIEQRPYQEVDQLTRIPGIGKNSLEELRPYLTVDEPPVLEPEVVNITITPENQLSPTEDFSEEVVESEILRVQESDLTSMEEELNQNPATPIFEETIESEADYPTFEEVDVLEETEPVIEEVDFETVPEQDENPQEGQPKPAQEEKSSEWVTRSQLLWSVVAAVVGSVLLTVALTLGIMAFINGDLRYATWNDAVHLSNQITVLTERNNDLQTELDNMRKRVDALETIAGRVAVLEETTQTLQEDLGQTQELVSSLEESVSAIQEDIQTLQGKVSEFNHAFLGIYQAIAPVVEPMLGEGN